MRSTAGSQRPAVELVVVFLKTFKSSGGARTLKCKMVLTHPPEDEMAGVLLHDLPIPRPAIRLGGVEELPPESPPIPVTLPPKGFLVITTHRHGIKIFCCKGDRRNGNKEGIAKCNCRNSNHII